MIHIKDASYLYKTEDEQITGASLLTCSIQENEFIAIVGANGSGKSTLARMLNGLLLPHEGSVSVDGLDTTDVSQLAKIRQLVGLVFQNPDNQLIGSTVEEDVAFGPENLGLQPHEIQSRVHEALKLVDMTEFASREPHMLSGGQKQRVALAGVLAMQPKYLVLDEATSMLDRSSAAALIETLHRLQKKLSITIIMITHQPEETIDADRIMVMNRGSIVLNGSPSFIYAIPEKLERCGVGYPKIARIAAQLQDAGIKIKNRPLTIDDLVSSLCESN